MDDGYFHGINKMKNPGFKVIKPPGGQTNINIFAHDSSVTHSPVNKCQADRNSSSIVFGGPVPMGVCQAERNSSQIVFGGPEPINNTPAATRKPAPAAAPAPPQAAAPAPAPVKAAAPAPTTPKNNVQQTPQNNRTPYTPTGPKMEVPQVRSSTKVMAPPGGRSSINLFGP